MRSQPLVRRLFALMLMPALLVLAACGGERSGSGDTAATPQQSAEQVTVAHAQGSTSVPKNPQKVIVFDVGVLATLDELGVKVAGVPSVENLPDNLAKYAGDEYPKVGSLFEPDYEKVNSLGPDLIIVAARSAAAYGELTKIARTVDLSIDFSDFLGSFRQRMEAIGAIFGKEAEVKQRLDAIDAAVQEAKAKAGDRTGLIVLTTGGKMSAFGPGSRFGLIHDVIGVKPADPNLKVDTHGEAITAEFIAKTDPDLLYVIDRDAAIGEEGQPAQKVLDNALVNGTKAAKNNKIIYLDPFTWYIAPNALSSVENMVKAVGDSLS